MRSGQFFHDLKPRRRDLPLLIWPGAIAFASALLGTCVGARLEAQRQQNEEQGIFNAKLTALSIEIKRDLLLIPTIRASLSSPRGDIPKLRNDAAQKVLGDFVTYNDGSPALYERAGLMVNSIDEVNNITDNLIDDFNKNGRYPHAIVEETEQALKNAEMQLRSAQELVKQNQSRVKLPRVKSG